MPQSLQTIAVFTASRLIGDGRVEISQLASVEHAKPGDLVFVQADRYLDDALNSQASAVIAGESAANLGGRKPLLINPRPRLAFATAAKLLYPKPDYPPAIHPSAIIDPRATVAASTSVDAHTVIEANAIIGECCCLATGCYIGEGVVIGNDCEIYPRVVVYPGTTIGRGVTIHAGAVLGSPFPPAVWRRTTRGGSTRSRSSSCRWKCSKKCSAESSWMA